MSQGGKEVKATDVEAIAEQASRLLAGRPPQLQGAVLADLLATWLAGHIIAGDPKSTRALHERLLKAHLAVVRELIPINAEMIHGTPIPPASIPRP